MAVGPEWRVASLAWRDSQRVEQLVLLFALALLVLRWPELLTQPAGRLSRSTGWLLGSLATLGLVSVALAHYPLVALVDYGLWLGCALLAWTIAAQRARIGAAADLPLLLILLVPQSCCSNCHAMLAFAEGGKARQAPSIAAT